MKDTIERVLNLLPEVEWDRWTGDLKDTELGVGVFGWVRRENHLPDFVFVRIAKDGAWMVVTSSAKYSADFARRLKLGSRKGHTACKRVEDYFPNVKAVRL